MNYFKKIIFPTLISIVLILVIILGIKSYISDVLGLNYMEKDELTQVLENNREVFEKASNELMILSENSDKNYCGQIEKISLHKILMKNKEDFIHMGNKVIIYPNPRTVFNSDLAESIQTNQIEFILKNLEIERIAVYKNYILFFNRTNIKFAVCLAYSENGEPDGEHLYNIEHIKGNWYYCLSE